jgi:hypothetical protein
MTGLPIILETLIQSNGLSLKNATEINNIGSKYK